MEEGYELDLTYVTERIIAVSFPQACTEETYLNNLKDVTRMLKSKHADNYLVINLSEKRDDLTKMNPKTLDTGWPDLHAPQLDKICTICKTMESWLHTDPQHVVVIHCRGGKGRIGVVISSFVYFTDISASADQALDRFAMRKFYDDKVSSLMTPSQKRYVWILSSLLSGSMKMNTSPLFLHCMLLHGIPNFDNSGVCRPYVKVYQGVQVVYSSGVYTIGPGHRHRVCIVLEPAQLLKGDIMVKCYHKRSPSQQEVIFRLQFHTGAVQNYSLMFEKEDMEHANKDPRFPDYGKVELVFSEGPERIQGAEHWQNGADVSVDYSATGSLTRWDSYQDLCNGEAPSLQSQVTTLDKFSPKRNQGSSLTLGRITRTTSVTSSPEHSDHALSASSDSGLSSASLWTERTAATASRPAGPSPQEKAELNVLLSGFGLDELRVDDGMEQTSTPQGALRRLPQAHLNGSSRPKERETDILDDEVLMSGHDMRSADSLGTLSSSCHQSSQNSLLSDGAGDDAPHHAPTASEEYERARNGLVKRTASLPTTETSCTPIRGQQFQQGGYSTQTWVQQQQMVAAPHYSYLPEEGGVGEGSCYLTDKQVVTPKTTNSERLTAAPNPEVSPSQESERSRDEEFNSLTVDIDNSIDQLNRLILDLDPTFVPIPTRSNSVKRHGGSVTPACSNGVLTVTLGESSRNQQQAVQPEKNKQGTEVHEHSPPCGRAAWELEQEFGNRVRYPHSIPTAQAPVYRPDSVEYRQPSAGLDTGADPDIDPVSTPAFPNSPPTPYVKTMPDLPHFAQIPSPSMPVFGVYRTENARSSCVVVLISEMRAYADIMGHDEITAKTSQRIFTHSNTTAGFMSLANSPAQSSCPEGALLPRHSFVKAQHSGAVDFSQRSPPSNHTHTHSHPAPAPGAHGSPRGDQGTRVVRYGFSHSPPQDFDEPEGFCRPPGPPGLPGLLLEPDVPIFQLQQPPLPEKRRASDCDHSIGSASPAPSGFSSPHSGSSLSIPFPSVLPVLQGRVAAVSPPSLLPDGLASKQVTVKFVQDTSKYWYKPDIARDQAIAVLKDKEPGSFIVRDSHSFKGAYGLAMKVATPPSSVLQQSKKAFNGDLSNELVRHFLIECTPKGVRLKGCPNEHYFGSLTALVYQHSITPLALPCKLLIPDNDPLEDAVEAALQSVSNSASELLKQGAACNVWFLGSVEMESLTGCQAVQKATTDIIKMEPPVTSTVVHFKVSSQGITLTDNQRKIFFRRHYAVSTVIFCALDPQDRKWRRDAYSSAKIFGFVARKVGSAMDNVCHVFAEHDPEQPASAIVNFVSKVMIGSQKTT
ncbi:tensin-3 isoform X2 [Electrophorus electricus]|uniref:tensin-3 isoform X2 n=1 Tax=Electrophorus electricus TaxID=8005 RepID=UPI0015CFC037|nr:tensin-3 isoform X2 [Electrophorus electricus]